jgi:hypothetical protein
MKQPARQRYFLRDYPTPTQRDIALEMLRHRQLATAARAALRRAVPERKADYRLARAFCFSWN